MGGNPKTVVQKAPGTESERMALDLSLEVEISQAEFFWAPDVAGVWRICGQKREIAADQRILVKGKFQRSASGRRSLDLRVSLRLREKE